MRVAMSAVVAEGQDGEPGGLDPTEMVLCCEADEALQFAQFRWAGKTAHFALSFPDGWRMATFLRQQRQESGH